MNDCNRKQYTFYLPQTLNVSGQSIWAERVNSAKKESGYLWVSLNAKSSLTSGKCLSSRDHMEISRGNNFPHIVLTHSSEEWNLNAISHLLKLPP